MAGLSDRLRQAGQAVFGPSAAAARIEGSKAFAKSFMQRHDIPTGSYRIFDDPNEAERYLRSAEYPLVIKADGLAAGKGVVIAEDFASALVVAQGMLSGKSFGTAGSVIVIGGGLALYNSDGVRIGGLGLSGDTACSDHIQAWKVRDALGLDYVPFGLSPTFDDNIIFDIADDFRGNPESPSGFGHPYCFNPVAEQSAVDALPVDFPIGPNP